MASDLLFYLSLNGEALDPLSAFCCSFLRIFSLTRLMRYSMLPLLDCLLSHENPFLKAIPSAGGIYSSFYSVVNFFLIYRISGIIKA